MTSAPSHRATAPISASSVDTTIRPTQALERACRKVCARSGTPSSGRRFFLGIPFEPPRAGTTHTTVFAAFIDSKRYDGSAHTRDKQTREKVEAFYQFRYCCRRREQQLPVHLVGMRRGRRTGAQPIVHVPRHRSAVRLQTRHVLRTDQRSRGIRSVPRRAARRAIATARGTDGRERSASCLSFTACPEPGGAHRSEEHTPEL